MNHRDVRQNRVGEWVIECFGHSALQLDERVKRVFEEVAELAQAEGLTREMADKIMDRVYSREAGDAVKEMGQVSFTLLAYAYAKHYSADRAEYETYLDATSKPPEHWRARHEAKVKQGIAI